MNAETGRFHAVGCYDNMQPQPPSTTGTTSALEFAESAAAVATALMAAGTPPEAGVLAQARLDLERALALAPVDLGVLFLAFQFHFRLGELDEAERWARRRLELAGADVDSEATARAYCNLGLIAFKRGRLDEAEGLLTLALEMSKRLGNQLGIARDLGNLALVPEARGDLDRAEALFREAMAVARGIEGAEAEEIVAGKLGNLGDITKARGKVEEARVLWTQAIEMFDRLGVTKWRGMLVKQLEETQP